MTARRLSDCRLWGRFAVSKVRLTAASRRLLYKNDRRLNALPDPKTAVPSPPILDVPAPITLNDR
jgi:hypothetical protein